MISEKSFSSINYIYTKARNGLDIKKINILFYIFINQRKLDSIDFHDTWFDEWLDANDTKEQDIVDYKNHRAWAEYKTKIQTAIQREREANGVDNEDEYENMDV